MKYFFGMICLIFLQGINAQSPWQQRADYQMEIKMDVENHQYEGKMKVKYENNSPHDLDKIYFHLYFNAFQPGSAMDARLQEIRDPDKRMVNNIGTKEEPQFESRIASLKPNEIGFQSIKNVTVGGKNLAFKVMGTLLEVTLDRPLRAGKKMKLEMEWLAQVPLQIRRSGRDNAEGVDYSMTQWYPKIAGYDRAGWHLDEYISREFYAPFANFDVKITMPKEYVIGASGRLQNAKEVKGYGGTPKNEEVTWCFKAKNIHDFAWAADPDFTVDKQTTPDGVDLFFVYQKNQTYGATWKELQAPTVEFFQWMSKTFGAYPWDTYTVVQGGDGGMEYGTITLVTGNRNLESLVGVTFHEAAHSWFQQLFGTDETQHEWMDEGFTSFAETLAHQAIIEKNITDNPSLNSYMSYYYLVESGFEEPISLLADYFDTNMAYGIGAYVKGQIYLEQLGYIVGKENLMKAFKKYYELWAMDHPAPEDFQQVVQETSGINIKWYQNLWTKTTRVINYSIKEVNNEEIILENESNLPMPIDLLVEYADGSRELFVIPLNAMRGAKPKEELKIYDGVKRTVLEPWVWTKPAYTIKVNRRVNKAMIDPTKRLADVQPKGNIYPATLENMD